VRILGEELGRVDVRTLRSRIAMVSASLARAFRPDIDVIDVIVTGKDGALERWWGTYPTQTVERANQLLESTGLRNRSHSPFAVLSEGERQRVLIARALMGEPELLLLDEPAAGLDLGAREDLISLMEQVVQTSAISGFVLVTHHVEEIPRSMTHGMLLREGTLSAKGAIGDVMTPQGLSACFGVTVTVTESTGRLHARARQRPIHQSEGKNP
jgi:iron complex transport system ATP-binding protein